MTTGPGVDVAPGAAVRRLTLLRHAKAEPGAVDHDRPLALRGREQCEVVAAHLRSHDRVPVLVLCSTALRTRQTWQLVERALAPDVEPGLRLLDDLYEAGVTDVLDAVAQVPDDVRDVLVVGHEPTMSEVGRRLAGPGSDDAAAALVRVGVPTASLLLLETERPWADLDRDAAVLRAVLTPKD